MANRYWVGGTANWDGTAGTKWAATSGGAGGASVPTSADDVFFDAASGVVTCSVSTGNTGAKSINFTGFTGTFGGSAPITVSGDLILSSGMIYSFGLTLTINGTGTIIGAGKTLFNIDINGAGITVTLGDAVTADTFRLTAGTLNLANFNLSTWFFISSNSNTRAISFGSGNIALTLSSGSPVDVLDMNIATGFTWTGSGGFTRNNHTGFGTVKFGFVGGAVSNAPNLAVNAGGGTFQISTGSYFKNVVFTGSTCTVSGSYNACGDLTLATGGNYISINPTFRASGTVTSVGKELGNLNVNGAGITVALADALTLGTLAIPQTLTLTQGTFTASNFNVTIAFFASSTTTTRTLNMGSGTWTIYGQSGSAWNVATSTNLTLNSSTSTINMTGSPGLVSFQGGGLTYYNFNQGRSSSTTITGSNTFNSITNSVQPTTVRFTAGTTQTVSNFGLSGTAGNLVTINSTTSGSQFTLSKSSGAVNTQYLSIQDSNAIGGATWDALISNGNVDAGNNTGWNFVPRSNMFLMFI